MTLKVLVLRYAAFAMVAAVANLATQRAVLHFGDTGPYFALAVGSGTFFALIIKYLLDKRWIFYDFASGAKNHGRKFARYIAMGVVTTAFFWTTETEFWLIWNTHVMRELGAVIGQTIGYIIKYNLDRRFVFTDRQLKTSQ